MMRVRDRDGECVRCVGTGNLGSGKQARHHRMDLRFLGASGADDRFLHQPRRIFSDIETRSRRDHDDDSTRLPELEGRLRIGVDEHLLASRAIWPLFGDQRLELVGKMREPARKRSRGVGFQLTVGDVAEAVAVGFDHTPARRAEARIESEDLQASFSSSSSGTS